MVKLFSKEYSLLVLLLFASVQMAAKVVDITEASKMAATFLSKTLMAKGQSARVKRVKPSANSRLLAPAVGDPAFYVFTPEEGKGFVIVSADDAATPVLGYSDTQNIDMDNLPPALEELMSQWTEQINYARSQGLESTADVKAKWAKASPSKTLVLLETAQWNQDSPYNNECPTIEGQHCYTGCVATGYAILMRYYSYAKAVSATTTPYTSVYGAYVPSRQIDGQYDWDNMPLTYPDGGYGDERDDAVAKLMADIGALITTFYGLSGSGAPSWNPELFDLFGYQYEEDIWRYDFTSDEWNEKLMNSLDLQHPISYSAHGSKGGHGFILDGYNEEGQYHVNWGWGGSCNGFYSLDALQTPKHSFEVVHMQHAILNICPIEEPERPAPDYVAKVGDFSFLDLQNAISYAEITGEELYLLKDISAYRIDETDSLKLNLNGHTLSIKIFNVFGTLTISDTNGGALNFYGDVSVFNIQDKCILNGITIRTQINRDYFFYIEQKGELNLYDCCIMHTGDEGAIGWNYGIVNVYSGRYKFADGFKGSGCTNFYGGIYSFDITNHVGEGHVVSDNTDPETREDYPYTIIRVSDFPEGTIVASVNGKQFNTLTSALRYAQTLTETANVILHENVLINSINTIKGNIVLDINGHNLKTIKIENKADLTICNTLKTGKIELTCNDYNIPLLNRAMLKLEDVTIEETNDNFYSLLYNSGTAELRNCTMRANVGPSVIYNYGGQCDIFESEITNLNDDAWNVAIWCSDDGITNINSGKYSAPNYSTGFETHDEGSQINIYGGLFSFDPSEYLAEGAEVHQNTDTETAAAYPYCVINTNPNTVVSPVDNGIAPNAYYTMDGKKIDNPRPGTIVITKFSDGSVSKKVWR